MHNIYLLMDEWKLSERMNELSELNWNEKEEWLENIKRYKRIFFYVHYENNIVNKMQDKTIWIMLSNIFPFKKLDGTKKNLFYWKGNMYREECGSFMDSKWISKSSYYVPKIGDSWWSRTFRISEVSLRENRKLSDEKN